MSTIFHRDRSEYSTYLPTQQILLVFKNLILKNGWFNICLFVLHTYILINIYASLLDIYLNIKTFGCRKKQLISLEHCRRAIIYLNDTIVPNLLNLVASTGCLNEFI